MNIKIIKADLNSDHFRQIARLHSGGITEGFLSTLGIPFLTRLYMGISQAKNSGVLVAVESVSRLSVISEQLPVTNDKLSGRGEREEESGKQLLVSQENSETVSQLGGESVSQLDGESVSQLEDESVRLKKEILGFVSYSQDVKSCYKEVLKSNFFALSIAMIANIFKLTIYKKVFETLLYPFLHKDNNPKKTTEEKTNTLRPELLSMAVSKDARGKGVGKLLVNAVDIAMKEMHIEGYYVVTHGIDERSNGFYQKCGFKKVWEFENHGKPMNEYFKSVKRRSSETVSQ